MVSDNNDSIRNDSSYGEIERDFYINEEESLSNAIVLSIQSAIKEE